jgi:hypothetical protein
MNITKAQYQNDPITNEPSSIKAIIDGVEMFVPIAPGNSHYQAIQDWIAAGNTPTPYTPPAPTAESVRSQRNTLLAETDWMALSDNTLTPEWAAYRQALRDITEQAGFPENVTWPTPPQ